MQFNLLKDAVEKSLLSTKADEFKLINAQNRYDTVISYNLSQILFDYVELNERGHANRPSSFIKFWQR